MPRPIGIYTPGKIKLPNPPLQKATLVVIEQAIVEAWRVIKDEPQEGFDLGNEVEDRITLELRNCLLDRVLDGGVVTAFTSDTFWVSRDAKYESYNGAHLDKMPDLHIYIVRNTSPGLKRADGLFVECKPVGKKHTVPAHYCKKGLARFVKGEYAWAMGEGLMVGYVSDGFAMPFELDAALKSEKTLLKPRGAATACPDSSAQGSAQRAHITTHRRGFIYPSTKGKAPDIVIRHLWLNRA